MTKIKRGQGLLPTLALLLVSWSTLAQAPSSAPVPAGDYRLDRAHSSLSIIEAEFSGPAWQP